MAICWPSVLILATWISVMNFTIEATTEKIVLAECAEMMSRNRSVDYSPTRFGRLHGSNAWELQRSLYSQAQSRTSWLHRFANAGCIQRYIQKPSVFHPMYKKLGWHIVDWVCREKKFLVFSPNVFMLVSSFNTRAAALYFRLGYEKLAPLKNYATDGFDEFLLRKTIGSLKNFNKSFT